MIVRYSISLLLFVAVAHAASLTGKVVGITDGDTITVLTPGKEQVKVRLYGIDAVRIKTSVRSITGG